MYLNNIVIYFKKKVNHVGYIFLVLQKLKQYTLYIKLFKYDFDTKESKFLKFIVDQFGIFIDFTKMSAIATWPVLESFQDI